MINTKVDASALNGFKNLDTVVQASLQTAIRELAGETHAHIVEQAHIKLHTRESMFTDALSNYQQDANTWVVNLQASARWIDEGMSPHNMISQLLKSKKTKTSKDGSRYLSIPFKHNKGPTQQTPAQALLLSTIKQVLKETKIPFSKAEVDLAGKVKTGLVRTIDITSAPLKTSHAPGQGKGQVGLVQQGWSKDGKSGIPLLQGLQVYQKQYQTTTGKTLTKKDFLTFRTVSSKHSTPDVGKGGQLKLFATGEARWDHPGLEPTHLMQEGLDWAVRQLNEKISPQLLNKIKIIL